MSSKPYTLYLSASSIKMIIKEISDATKQLTAKDLEKLGLTKNKKNNG